MPHDEFASKGESVAGRRSALPVAFARLESYATSTEAGKSPSAL